MKTKTTRTSKALSNARSGMRKNLFDNSKSMLKMQRSGSIASKEEDGSKSRLSMMKKSFSHINEQSTNMIKLDGRIGSPMSKANFMVAASGKIKRI